MSKDVLKCKDMGGDSYSVIRGDEIPESDRFRGIVAKIDVDRPPLWLDKTQATELVTFLLPTLGPDAAREALTKLAPGYEIGECISCRKTTLIAPTGESGASSICLPCLEVSARDVKEVDARGDTAPGLRARAQLAERRAELAEKRLAAVLALTDRDIQNTRGETIEPAKAEDIIDLIHSRATEGAESPPERRHDHGGASRNA